MPKRIVCCVTLSVVLLSSWNLQGQEKLVVISPHRKSIQRSFLKRFEEHYQRLFKKSIKVEWIDNGGAANNLRYIRSRLEANPKAPGIDLFWGGGEQPHLALLREKALQPISLTPKIIKAIPAQLRSTKTRDSDNHWFAINFTTFGIFSNLKLLSKLQKRRPKLVAPKGWKDLADPSWWDLVSLADPRHSSSYLSIYELILQSYGWKDGWELLAGLAANASKFAQSSTDPIKHVVSGQALASICVGYFGRAKVQELGSKLVSFVVPTDGSVLNTDPISVLKNARNPIAAKAFVEFLLAPEQQQLFLLPSGQMGLESYLGRLAVHPHAYKLAKIAESIDPYFTTSASLAFDHGLATRRQSVLADLFGTVLVDLHQELKQAARAREAKQGLAFPISEKQVAALAKNWHKQIFRNQKINGWINQGRTHYAKLSKSKVASLAKAKFSPDARLEPKATR